MQNKIKTILMITFLCFALSGCGEKKASESNIVTETRTEESETAESEAEVTEAEESEASETETEVIETEESEVTESEVTESEVTESESTEENEVASTENASEEKKTVACIGDSLTYGTISISNQAQTENPYPSVLNSLLGDGYEVLNFGEPGAPLTGDELSYLYRESYAPSVEAAADMYIIMLGTNDSNLRERFNADTFRSALKDLIDTYKNANADTEIYLVTPPVLISAGEDEYDQYYLLTTYVIPIIEEVATEKGVGLIDVFSATKDHTDWLADDGVHFIDEGYIQIANTIYNGITL